MTPTSGVTPVTKFVTRSDGVVAYEALQNHREVVFAGGMITFTKMNGAGNDFVVMDNRTLSLNLSLKEIERICDRHRGVGADGLLLVEPAQAGADFRMRYYNSDGGEAEMCGNGARCFARFAQRVSGHGGSALSFETQAGVIHATFDGALVHLNMSDPQDLREPVELEVNGVNYAVHFVNTGVPHAVIVVDEVETIDLPGAGRAIRRHPHFAPAGTNVNFLARTGDDHGAVRTYERGVEGETLACGTGVVACGIIFRKVFGGSGAITLRVRGGDDLTTEFREEGGVLSGATLKGPADFVFNGQLEL